MCFIYLSIDRSIGCPPTVSARYCRDRCLATGFCDVFEEAYDYSQEEARAFCTECVVAVDEDGDEHLCDLPEGSIEQYYEDLLKENRKKGLRL
mmetsp:Transcript_4696/g.9227  ORF Transcript_4696/g.9227 Transcript_4696/m.9227 type:complete len:93 (+) Transcript_4696:755-1033(+)